MARKNGVVLTTEAATNVGGQRLQPSMFHVRNAQLKNGRKHGHPVPVYADELCRGQPLLSIHPDFLVSY